MKNIKKIIALLLAAALLIAAGACGLEDPAPSREELEAAAKEYAAKLLERILTELDAPKSETGDAHVSDTTAEVHVMVGEKEFTITLTKDADGNWEGEAPKELNEYLEELKKPEQPENPENPDQPDNPENPDTPENPDQPENPENSDNPENPDEPVDTDTPDNPPEDPKPADDPKPEHEHKYSEKVTKEPTCTKEGVKTYTCSCGDSYTKPIKAKGHKYKDKVVEPTKTEKGYTLHTCTVCGYEYKDKYMDPIGGGGGTHTHQWEEVYDTIHHDEEGHYEKKLVKEAWDEPVYEVKNVCKKCGAYFDKVIEVVDHIAFEHDGEGTYTTKEVLTHYIHHDAEYKDVWIVDKPAWDEKKLTGYKCKTCGETKGAGGNAVILPEDKKRKAAKTNNNYLLQYS